MSRQDVFDLLDGADASSPPPPPVGNLAEKVRMRARSRACRRRMCTAAAVLLVSGVVPLLVIRSRGTLQGRPPHLVQSNASVPAPDAEALRLEADGLRAAAIHHLAVARGAASEWSKHRRLVAARHSTPAPPGALDDERDRAALVMLDHADRLRRDLKEIDAALAAYRRTVELFPDTRWAGVARQRIAEIRPEAGRPQAAAAERLT